jgi:general secretion pathway protein D
MIERERQRILQTGKPSTPEQRALTPMQQMQAETDERLDRIQPVPELRPLGPTRFDLKINSNIPKTLFETLGAFAGINVFWDSDMTPANTAPLKTASVNFQNSTLNEALDYLALLTKFFWKPLSPNAIFVTNDTKPKRNDYGDQVLKVFYVSNVQNQQDLAEMVNAIRTVAEVQRMFAVNSQNAIVARGDADQMALVEKIIHDLDRPKPEVVVDVIVMQTSSNYSRQLAAALMPMGLNMPLAFTPPGSSSSTAGSTTTTGTTTTGGTTTSTTPTTAAGTLALSAASMGHLSSGDWSTTLPSGLLEAVMSDSGTKILQAPQVRAVDNAKASMKIGEREPTASGSFGSALGLSGAGVSPLVNTQFTYLDIGVNVDMLPRVHDNGDVSLHIELEISSIDGTVNLGGINEPVIAQKKIINDIRLREGEVNLLGGLIDEETDTTKTGVPGLVDIPLLGRLFRSDSVTKTRSELMIAIVPHIIRRPVFSAENLRAIDVGTANAIHLSYAPKPDDGTRTPPGTTAPEAGTVITPPVVAAAPAGPVTPATNPVVQSPAAAPSAPGAPGVLPGQPVAAPGLPFPLQQLMRPMPGGAPGMPPGASPTPQPGTAPANPAAPAPATPPAGTASATPTGQARFEPAQFQAAANGQFTAALILDTGADVVSAQPLQVKYDPKLLRLTDVSAGDIFSRDGAAAVFTKDIQDDQGLATVQLARQPGALGVNAPGTLLTLKFQALAPGATTVSVLNVTPRNSQGRVVGSSNPQLAVTIK